MTSSQKPSSGAEPRRADSDAVLPAKAIVARLLADGFVPHADGYTVSQALSCAPPKPDDDYAQRCIAFFRDGQRGGKPAVVEIRLYDSDRDFALLEKPLKDHVAGMKGRWTLDTAPEITLTKRSTGAKTTLQTGCHQSLGSPNGPAYCAVMFTPRIFVTAGVQPARAVTTHMTMSTGPAPDAADADVDHASDLSIMAVTMIGGLL